MATWLVDYAVVAAEDNEPWWKFFHCFTNFYSFAHAFWSFYRSLEYLYCWYVWIIFEAISVCRKLEFLLQIEFLIVPEVDRWESFQYVCFTDFNSFLPKFPRCSFFSLAELIFFSLEISTGQLYIWSGNGHYRVCKNWCNLWQKVLKLVLLALSGLSISIDIKWWAIVFWRFCVFCCLYTVYSYETQRVDFEFFVRAQQ